MAYQHALFIAFLLRPTVVLANIRTDSHSYGKTAGEALYLTPLIESGNIARARNLAIVRHKEIGHILSYSGYFTVDEQYDSNIFFWFFPAQISPEAAAVLVWLNGGPGLTSLLGLFTENGPFRVRKDGILEPRDYPWTRTHSVLYIDSPVGSGYSFTRNDQGYARNQTRISKHLLESLVQFYELFPEFRANELFVIGEAYGGKSAATLSHSIAEWNSRSLGKKMNLQGLAISNGYISPEDQITVYDSYLHEIGLIDSNAKALFRKTQEKIRGLIRDKRYREANFQIDYLLDGTKMQSVLQKLTGYYYYSNYLHNSAPDDSTAFSQWVQRIDVRRAIHVGEAAFRVNNLKVRDQLAEDLPQSVAPVLARLVERYRILFYNGQLDMISPYTSIENLLRNLRWSGAAEYSKAPRTQWWVGQELAGYSKSVGNLMEVLVRAAGHEVSADQPKWALDLVTKFTKNQPLTRVQQQNEL